MRWITDAADRFDSNLAGLIEAADGQAFPASLQFVDDDGLPPPTNVDMSGGTWIQGVKFYPPTPGSENGLASLHVFPSGTARVDGALTSPEPLMQIDNPDDLHSAAIAQKVSNLGADGELYDVWNAWNQVKDHAQKAGLPEPVYNTDSMYQQFVCHWVFATKKPGDTGWGKPSWNLEPDRPAVGTVGCIEKKCNP